jgi:hypothetical protein
VSVKVQFPRGMMTEWYPAAAVRQPIAGAVSLANPDYFSEIEWPAVTIDPSGSSRFPRGARGSHYYAARETEAAPLLVQGQPEKFLFYRGVAGFDVPINARVLPNGSIHIRNFGGQTLPSVVLFERRGNAVGYTVLGALRDSTTVQLPSLTANVASLHSELERTLTSAGLYPKEASAMIETWRDSWFEEGVRVFYVLPQSSVDAILPLRITPAPSEIKRVFVGRMDVITPTMEAAVRNAVVRGDGAVLARYGRLLAPIVDRIAERGVDAALGAKLTAATRAAFASYVTRLSACE